MTNIIMSHIHLYKEWEGNLHKTILQEVRRRISKKSVRGILEWLLYSITQYCKTYPYPSFEYRKILSENTSKLHKEKKEIKTPNP